MCDPTSADDDHDQSDADMMGSNSPHSPMPLSPGKIDDCILTLRDVFVAVDFDAKLWDSLFSCNHNSVGPRSTISWRETQSPDVSQTMSSPYAATNATIPCHFTMHDEKNDRVWGAPISSLASVLAFLEIDDSSIPKEYLTIEPASIGLEQFMFHHPHAHDRLLHVITSSLLRITTDLHSHFLAEQARSIQEHVDMLNRAIQQLTEINRSQFPEEYQHHQRHHKQNPLSLHRAVSSSATCTNNSIQSSVSTRGNVPSGRKGSIRGSPAMSTKVSNKHPQNMPI